MGSKAVSRLALVVDQMVPLSAVSNGPYPQKGKSKTDGGSKIDAMNWTKDLENHRIPCNYVSIQEQAKSLNWSLVLYDISTASSMALDF